MNRTNILIGSPICQEPLILKQYLLSLINLEVEDYNIDFLFIDDNSQEEPKNLLRSFSVSDCKVDIIDMHNKEEYVHTNMTHKWQAKLICKVAGYRNRILTHAKQKNYDYLFMVDSDLMLNPKTLSHLISQNKDIISEIFWTKWAPGGKEFPQVWLYDNYTLYEIDKEKYLPEAEINFRTAKFLSMLKVPGVYKVGGLGACTLISKKALNSSLSFDKIPNLSYPGEDRHFCIRAAVLGFDLYVDTHYPAYHIYRKSELKGAEEYKRKCGYRYLDL